MRNINGNVKDKKGNIKHDSIISYPIEPKYLKILEILYKVYDGYKSEILLKDNLMLQIEELIYSKEMSCVNIFLVMNSLQASIEQYINNKEKGNNLIILAMSDLHNYFSKYFSVSRTELDFICIDKKSNRTITLKFTVKV